MKRIIALTIILLTTAIAKADERSSALLSKMSRKIAESGNYRIDFSSTVEGQPAANGYYIVRGNDYYICTPEAEIFCIDGVSYEIDGINCEVVIEQTDVSQEDILSNPVRVFSFLDKSYRHDYAGSQEIAGRKCEIVSIEKIDGGDRIRLYIDSQTALPVRADYYLSSIDADAAVEVHGFESGLPDSAIELDLSRLNDYEIIDFRH